MIYRLLPALLIGSLAVLVVGCDKFGAAKEEDPAVTQANTTKTNEQITRLVAEIDKYKNALGSYPKSNLNGDTNELAKALEQNGYTFADGERKGNMRGEIIDAWGNVLQYRVTAEIPDANERKAKQHNDTYDLYSAGPDGVHDTEDDLGNW